MHVDAVGREARDQRSGKELGGVRDGGVGVDAEGGPVVLVLEVVLDLEREVVVMGRMGQSGWRLGVGGDGICEGG